MLTENKMLICMASFCLLLFAAVPVAETIISNHYYNMSTCSNGLPLAASPVSGPNSDIIAQ